MFYHKLFVSPARIGRSLLLLMLACALLGPGARPGFAQVSRPSLDDALRGYEASTHTAFRGLPEDWSTHHVVFSAAIPGSRMAATVRADPRFWLQQIRQRIGAGGAAAAVPLTGTVASAATLTAVAAQPAQRDWSENLGSHAKVGSGEYPAKFSFSANATPDCLNDYVAFNTSLTGSATQASIVAFNQLYKPPFCSGQVPSTLWAANTGGAITMSPVLSLDGSQLAFIQTVNNVASLVVLKWAAGGTVGAPVAPVNSGSYPACTAPCMITLPLAGSPADKNSAPFYDYSGSDTLVVGDATGKLHLFHPVFNGPPAEVTSGGFPVTVSQNAQPLADAVYDSGLGMVFVGDGHKAGATNDGEVHAINVTTGAVVNSAPVCQGPGFLDGPILDPVAGKLYFTCGHDAGGGACSSSNACLRQFDEGAISGSSGAPEPLGADFNCSVAPGAFDNLYMNSNGTSPSGNLYVCGNPGDAPTLYRVPVTNNALGAPVAVAALANWGSYYISCSPVTEFYNSQTSTDWLFLSVSAYGAQSVCTATDGCVYSFDATTPLAAGATASAGLPASGGSSGLIVDNIGAATSTVANVYYATLANQKCTTSGGSGGCAVQASQNQLQ